MWIFAGTFASAMPLGADAKAVAENEAVEIVSRRIAVGEMVFDARTAGPETGPLVVLLHGFPETSYAWVEQLRWARGFYAVAPDQRGYSPDARPDGVEQFAMRHLIGDVVGLVGALGRESFHLVGHDWGGAVAWVFASTFPDRLESLTVLSTPHYGAFQTARDDPASDQSKRSSYFAEWAKPDAAERMLENDAEGLRAILASLPRHAADAYFSVLSDPSALRAALHWYGALQASPPPAVSSNAPPPAVRVPTLYVWGDADSAFGREVAEATAAFVAGSYRFVPLAGAGHWLTHTESDRVNELLGEHLAAHR